MDKERFKQLYQLAHGGDMEAKADLWIEFEFAFDHDPLPDFMREPPLPGGSPSSVTDRTAGVPPALPANCNAEGGAPC